MSEPRTEAPAAIRWAETWHDVQCGTDHPLSDHEPFDTDENDISWSEIEDAAARNGLHFLAIEAEAGASSLSVEAPQLDVERAAWDEGYEAGKTNAEELALMRPVGRGRFTEPDSEHCRECRLPVGIWYEAIGDLWAKVTGRNDGSGILCAGCFDVQAAKKGIGVRWEAHHEAG